jgi:predicted dithiol-disulfide oxidoreductase (DUF899 family)
MRTPSPTAAAGASVPGRRYIRKGDEEVAMPQTRLDESAEYAKCREELRLAEVDLMRQREQVAELRRRLPLGSEVEDFEFLEGPPRLDDGDAPVSTVRLRELFSAPDRALVVQHVMYGKAQTTPCPMCTMWIDGLNGVVRHLQRNVDFVVASAADPATLRAHARDRGWDDVRLLSCGDNTFQFDLGAEDEEGRQDSTVSVFVLDDEGRPRHFYSCHPHMADDIRERGIDLLSPVWHVLDLTPQGRGEWYASLEY